jgi:thiol-disulfide isomerase/thioredoxin
MRVLRRTLLLASLIFAVACGSNATSPLVADIELVKLDGTTTSIGVASSDRPLLVSLWAVWCQPCKRELPALEEIALERQDLAVLAINIGDDPTKIEEYLQLNGLSLPVAIDNNGELLEALDAPTVPVTVLFDTDGNVVWRHLGVVDVNQVNEAIDQYTNL